MAKYYYIDSNKQKAGPLSVEELINLGIVRETPVWTEGMSNWTQAGIVPDFKEQFDKVPPYFEPGNGVNNNCQNFRPVAEPPFKKPDNWLVWSILCTLLCSQIFGIVGIVFACQVDSAWNAGRYEEARSNAKKAKLFTLIGIGLSLLMLIIAFVVYFGSIIALFGLGAAASNGAII